MKSNWVLRTISCIAGILVLYFSLPIEFEKKNIGVILLILAFSVFFFGYAIGLEQKFEKIIIKISGIEDKPENNKARDDDTSILK